MKKKKPQGFAAISREYNRKIASMGGKAAHKKGTAHQWNSKEASIAGRKGGLISRKGKKKNETRSSI